MVVIVFILSSLSFNSGFAQDIIVLKSRDTVKCEITKVDTSLVMFNVLFKNDREVSTYISKDSILSYSYGPKRSKPCFRINLGLGVSVVNGGLGGDDEGPSIGLSFSSQDEKNIFTVRSIICSEFKILGPSPSEGVWDFGVLYGRTIKDTYSFASLSGGISYVNVVRRGGFISSNGWFDSKYEKLVSNTVGIPIEGQFFFTPFPFLGIGIYGFANINPEKSFYGCLISVQFGRLR